MPRARTSDGCAQHHGQCEPWDRHPHTIRARDDDWEDAQDTHGSAELAGYIAETMQARRGKLRCRRCLPGAPPVPLISGDLTGRPLDEWISRAVRQAEGQHPRHEPVWLGAEPSGPIPVVFMPPMPAGRGTIGA